MPGIILVAYALLFVGAVSLITGFFESGKYRKKFVSYGTVIFVLGVSLLLVFYIGFG